MPSSSSMSSSFHDTIIVGAGPSGLASLRAIKENNTNNNNQHSILCLEASSCIGGIWQPSSKNGGTWDGMKTNLSREKCAFKGLTHEEVFKTTSFTSDFPTSFEMYDYFKAFAEKYDLMKHILFEQKVTRIARDQKYRYKISVVSNQKSSDGETPQSQIYFCNTLVMAIGVFNTPKMYPEMIQKCKAANIKVAHSSLVGDPKKFLFGDENNNDDSSSSKQQKNNIKVLFVGSAYSGADMAVAFKNLEGKYQTNTEISVVSTCRKTRWIMPRKLTREDASVYKYASMIGANSVAPADERIANKIARYITLLYAIIRLLLVLYIFRPLANKLPMVNEFLQLFCGTKILSSSSSSSRRTHQPWDRIMETRTAQTNAALKKKRETLHKELDATYVPNTPHSIKHKFFNLLLQNPGEIHPFLRVNPKTDWSQIVICDDFLDYVRDRKITLMKIDDRVHEKKNTGKDEPTLTKSNELGYILKTTSTQQFPTAQQLSDEGFTHCVLATGFTSNLDTIMDADLIQDCEPDFSTDFLPLLLYKSTLHPTDESLYFCGLYRGPYLSALDIQARWIGSLIGKKYQRPPQELLLRQIREQEKRMREQKCSFTPGEDHIPNAFPHGNFLSFADSMGVEFGALPKNEESLLGKNNIAELY